MSVQRQGANGYVNFGTAVHLLEQTLEGPLAPEVHGRLEAVLDYLKTDLLRVGDAAHMLGVSENTVKNWARQERFPSAFQTEGGHWRFKASEVLALRDASERARSLNATGRRPAQEKFAGDPFEDVPVF